MPKNLGFFGRMADLAAGSAGGTNGIHGLISGCTCWKGQTSRMNDGRRFMCQAAYSRQEAVCPNPCDHGKDTGKESDVDFTRKVI
jgi:hypothetical protein